MSQAPWGTNGLTSRKPLRGPRGLQVAKVASPLGDQGAYESQGFCEFAVNPNGAPLGFCEFSIIPNGAPLGFCEFAVGPQWCTLGVL